jgi:hypothetical protein
MNIIQLGCGICIGVWLATAYHTAPLIVEGKIPLTDALVIAAAGIASVGIAIYFLWLSTPRGNP